MKAQSLRAARIDFSGDAPRSLDYGDLYHPREGAHLQFDHVFLQGSGLPNRWSDRERFSILETGFGLGHNFIAIWAAWRQDPRRCKWLEYVSLELHPPTPADLRRAHGLPLEHPRGEPQLIQSPAPSLSQSPTQSLVRHLLEAWPPMTRGLHRLSFEEGRVQLTLGLGDARRLLPHLVGSFDAFFLDGFAPSRNPELWETRLLRALPRLARSGATAATWCVAGEVRRGLQAAGFDVQRVPGTGSKREVLRAHFDPPFIPRRPAGRPHVGSEGSPTLPSSVWPSPSASGSPRRRREALVVGAGLAGAAAAAALARHGWHCTVLEADAAAATGASGNPAGLFHGTLHPQDSLHARLHRAGALHAARHYAPLIASGAVPGALQGLLSVKQDGSEEPITCESYASVLNAQQAQLAAGQPLPCKALLYRQAGWIAPKALVQHWLQQPGVQLQTGARVDWIRPPEEAGGDWTVGGEHGTLAHAPVLVLASGALLPRLAAAAGFGLGGTQVVRGQLQWCAGAPRLARPVSGHGYALSLDDGRLVFGAASRPGDARTQALDEDIAWNLERLKTLTGIDACALSGEIATRVGFRLGTVDRLPLIGPVPVLRAAAQAGPQDQVRRVPRLEGLFVVGGFGSRGLNWAPLAGDILLGWLEGLLMPLEADLLDAVDPAREWIRHQRRPGRD